MSSQHAAACRPVQIDQKKWSRGRDEGLREDTLLKIQEREAFGEALKQRNLNFVERGRAAAEIDRHVQTADLISVIFLNKGKATLNEESLLS